jgi:hypothetical protein
VPGEGRPPEVLDELRAFAAGEANSLAGLESTLSLLRRQASTESFDEEAIWRSVERSLWSPDPEVPKPDDI